MNVTIRGLDDRVYRRFKARAVAEGMRVGEAASQAMELWVTEITRGQRSKLIEMPSFDWGEGTEGTSEEIDELLYGGGR